MDDVDKIINFYKGKTILITGHTGFKGSWLSKMLIMFGANVVGYSLEPQTEPSLFSILGLPDDMTSIIGDIRDYDKLKSVFDSFKPDIVFHLAAQPIVRESYRYPKYTYDVNVLGTVNICECIRTTECVKSFLNVTTDKVYENNDDKNHPFIEDEKLDGFDPYSNSKSCSELVTHSYYRSFFKVQNIATSTARAGNVIGGGDFAIDRIIPDCYRSIKNNSTLIIRNPNSIRPYQHVLEPLFCYLVLAKKQYKDNNYCGSYNIGPDIEDTLTTEKLVKMFFEKFPHASYLCCTDYQGPHEASLLMLNNSKIKKTLGWKPHLSLLEAVSLTSDWYNKYLLQFDMKKVTEDQIKYFLELINGKTI